MVNVAKLKGKFVENGKSVPKVAEEIGMSRDSLYRKLRQGERFTIKDAVKISNLLGLTLEEVNSIFFADYVA